MSFCQQRGIPKKKQDKRTNTLRASSLGAYSTFRTRQHSRPIHRVRASALDREIRQNGTTQKIFPHFLENCRASFARAILYSSLRLLVKGEDMNSCIPVPGAVYALSSNSVNLHLLVFVCVTTCISRFHAKHQKTTPTL